ncbi:Esterase/lipase/thioesterase [Rhizophlyctis rosea]|uniref:lytic cellulose monooxygenase (C4-dehydrogenating) n=1 Tax=Rhizophlyctis rosea TaxID=64517 RepID=A0AAD5X6K3_9FUNG|nr:Esterase/lipase/thioesterase [Rhizophlyctis rosea]
MKFLLATLAIAPIASVFAHGIVSEATLDGKTYPGWNFNSDNYIQPPPQRIFRKVPGNGPVCDITLIDLQCNGYTAGNFATAPAALSAPVTAGSTVSLKWTLWPDTHFGSTATYLAKCPGDCSTYSPGTAAVWFKIAEAGKISYGTGGLQGRKDKWATDAFVTGAPYTFTIPKSLANGNYIVRHEITALHGAYAYTAGKDGCSQGIQYYPSCFQITVTGGGSATGPANKVSIPGYITPSSPGVVYDGYKNEGSPYPIPGPAVWDGSSGGGSNPTTTQAPPRTTTTTTRAPVTTSTSVRSTTSTRPATTTTTTRATGGTGAPLGADQNWTSFIHYADQSEVEIEWYSETIRIGNVSVSNVTFGAAVKDTVPPGPTTPFFDGIFGLAFPYLNDHEVQPWFHRAVSNSVLPEPIFGLYFYSDPTYRNFTATGQLTLGGYDSAHFSGDLTWHNAVKMYYPFNDKEPVDYGFWALEPQEYRVGEVGWVAAKNVTDFWIVDSGTSWLILPTHMFNALVNATNGVYDTATRNATVSCDLAGFPDVAFVFDGKNYTLTPEDYVELDQTQDPVQCILAATDAEAEDIWEVKAPFVLGAVFLRKYYSAYDIDKKRIGFAPARVDPNDILLNPISTATDVPAFDWIPGLSGPASVETVTEDAETSSVSTEVESATETDEEESGASATSTVWDTEETEGATSGIVSVASVDEIGSQDGIAGDAAARNADFEGALIGMFY